MKRYYRTNRPAPPKKKKKKFSGKQMKAYLERKGRKERWHHKYGRNQWY